MSCGNRQDAPRQARTRRLTQNGDMDSSVVNALVAMAMAQNTKMRGCTPLPRQRQGLPEPVQVLGVHHGKNQHLQHTRHQKGGPCNPHQALRPAYRFCLLVLPGSPGATCQGFSGWSCTGVAAWLRALRAGARLFPGATSVLLISMPLAVKSGSTTGSGREIASRSVTKPATITIRGLAITSTHGQTSTRVRLPPGLQWQGLKTWFTPQQYRSKLRL